VFSARATEVAYGLFTRGAGCPTAFLLAGRGRRRFLRLRPMATDGVTAPVRWHPFMFSRSEAERRPAVLPPGVQGPRISFAQPTNSPPRPRRQQAHFPPGIRKRWTGASAKARDHRPWSRRGRRNWRTRLPPRAETRHPARTDASSTQAPEAAREVSARCPHSPDTSRRRPGCGKRPSRRRPPCPSPT
jgi:hypothetical protein